MFLLNSEFLVYEKILEALSLISGSEGPHAMMQPTLPSFLPSFVFFSLIQKPSAAHFYKPSSSVPWRNVPFGF